MPLTFSLFLNNFSSRIQTPISCTSFWCVSRPDYMKENNNFLLIMEAKSKINETPKIKKNDSIKPDFHSNKTGNLSRNFMLESAGK